MAFISRRTFLQHSAAGACAAFAGCTASTARRQGPPNVLLIVLDDLNDWVGFMAGHPQARTPNMDRLARRGVVFERAYCQAPLCNPSRVSTLTGLQPTTTGIYRNVQRLRDARPDVVTLPQYFTAHGYEVIGAGKVFHGGFNDDASWPEYFDAPFDPLPENRPLNGLNLTKPFDWGPLDVADEEMGDYQVVNWANHRLRAARAKPLFLAVGLTHPHVPLYVPRKYFDLFPLDGIQLPEVKDNDLDDVPPLGKELAEAGQWHAAVTAAGQWPRAVQAYLASIAFADTQVGRLLDALEGSPAAENTIVVLWSDNGWHLGQKQHWHKQSLWEESTHVPLVIATPGDKRRDSRCPRVVELVDLYPTLLDLCGLPEKDGLDGRSLAPLLETPGAPWDHPALTTMAPGHYSIRSERWRYIRYSDATEELYDHDHGPREWVNLAADPALADVKTALAARIPQKTAPPAPEIPKTWIPR
jgi:arylsulfatase A-like enzyme